MSRTVRKEKKKSPRGPRRVVTTDGDGPRGSVDGSTWKGHRILHTKREEINWKADSFARHLATHIRNQYFTQVPARVWQHRLNEFLKWHVALRKRDLLCALEKSLLYNLASNVCGYRVRLAQKDFFSMPLWEKWHMTMTIVTLRKRMTSYDLHVLKNA